MKFATLPTWTFDRPLASSGQPYMLPFPLPGEGNEHTPVAYTYHPITLPLTKAVEWWWRFRTLTATATFDFGGGEVFGPYEFEMTRSAATESDMVYRPLLGDIRGWLWQGNIYEVTPARTISAMLAFLPPEDYKFAQDDDEIEVSYYIPQPDAAPENIDIAPCLILDLTVFFESGLDYSGRIISYNSPSLVTANISNHSATLDGYTIPMKYSGDTALTSCTVSIIPTLWWPWANADGSHPTWNELTGARA